MQNSEQEWGAPPPGVKVHEGERDARGLRVAVIVSRYHGDVTGRLRDGACRALFEAGVVPQDLELVTVPGSFELGYAVQQAARSRRFQAVVALGCLIQGATIHMDVIAREVVQSFGATQRETGVPIGFGLLTVTDHAEALARAGGAEGNKGEEAARAAIEMARLAGSLVGGA